MTDEELIKKIVDSHTYVGDDIEYSDVVAACQEMAEQKDQQFISMLPEIFDYFDNVVGLYDGGPNHSDKDKPEFIRYFSNKISNTK